MTVFGDTNDLPSEIKKLHKEIDQLRNSSEFQPILTTGRSDDGYGASVGSKTMNSGGVWALTPVVHSVEKLTNGATTFDKIELISACVTVDVNTAQSNWQNITELELKTLRMGSTNDPNASTVTNSAPNGAILFIKPVRGKTLTLKTGGNIHLSQDVTLDEKAFAILQFYVDATGTGANEANKNKDFGQLLEMADEYGIDVPMDDRMMLEVQKQIKAVVDTITKMKSTWAWTWVHIDKGSKDMFKKYILQQLTVE